MVYIGTLFDISLSKCPLQDKIVSSLNLLPRLATFRNTGPVFSPRPHNHKKKTLKINKMFPASKFSCILTRCDGLCGFPLSILYIIAIIVYLCFHCYCYGSTRWSAFILVIRAGCTTRNILDPKLPGARS